MYFNRSALKQHAKGMIGQGTPPVWQVTLVYILATTWLSTITGLVLKNPVNGVMDVMNTWYASIAQTGYLSDSALNAMNQQIWACFQGPAAMVGLLAALIIGFYSLVVTLGYYGYSLQIMRGQEGGYADLFSNFYMVGKIILLMILKVVFIYLWCMLFVIPGIVAAYRYRLAEYCLLDDPDISPLEAIRRSKALMRGRKGDLFVVDLSFLGWMLLQGVATELVSYLITALTGLNVAAYLVSLAVSSAISLFLLSYQQLTEAGFYLFALGNQAPPVQDPNQGFEPFNRHDDISRDGEGWNQ